MSERDRELQRDCRATRIPAGDDVLLEEGSTVIITQSLGGSFTVRFGGELFRLAAEDADALGEDITALEAPVFSSSSSEEYSDEQVWSTLKTCFDPEIPVNIVDLGLIYDLSTGETDTGERCVDVRMTLTAQGCGMGPTIAADAKSKIEALPSVASANVEIVWDPVWTPHMISREGREVMGLD